MDWYLILFVAMTLLIFHMKEFGEHPNVHRYIHDRGNVPVSAGAMQLVFRLMSGTFLFLPFYFTLLDGYLAGIVLALSGVFVLVVFSGQVEKLSGQIISYGDRQAFLTSKFTKKGLFAFYGLMFIASLEGLLVSTLLAGQFIERAFHIPAHIAILPILFFSFVFAGMGGNGGVRRIGTVLIMLFFISISLIPLSAFLINGAKPIHTVLYAENSAGLVSWHLVSGTLLFIPVMAGHLMTYLTMSSDLISIKRNRVKLSVRLGMICWSAIPLAVSLIVIYLLAITSGKSPAGLLENFQEHMPILLIYALLFVVLSSFAMGIGLSIFTLTSIILTNFSIKKSSVQKGYLVSLLLCIIPLGLMNGTVLSLNTILLFFATLFASIGFPIWQVFKSNKKWGINFSVGILFFVIAGSWISIQVRWSVGIPISIVGSGVFVFIRNIRKIQ